MTYVNKLNYKALALVTALYLVAGCSSGSSSGGGAGAANTYTTNDGTTFTASVLPEDGGVSIDTLIKECEPAVLEVDENGVETGKVTTPAIDEPPFTARFGTLTITARSTINPVDPTLFPGGTTFNRYSVSYAGEVDDAGQFLGPTLSPVNNLEQSTSENGATEISVLLFGRDVLREYQSQNPSGKVVYRYRVSVAVQGQTLLGETFSLIPTTTLRLGDFDLCDDA